MKKEIKNNLKYFNGILYVVSSSQVSVVVQETILVNSVQIYNKKLE